MKLDTSLYRVVAKRFSILESFRRGSQVWRTERQTDGMAVSISGTV